MAREKVFEHVYVDLFFDNETSIFEEIWKPETEKMTDEEFKAYQFEKLKVAENCMPKLFFCDTKNYLYTMVPEIQEWTEEHVVGFWVKIGLQRHAFIVSEGEIEQLALELMMEENPLPFPVKYFDNQAAAIQWLLEKE